MIGVGSPIRARDTEDFVLQDCRVPEFNRIDADFKKTAPLSVLRCKWLEEREGRRSGATKVEASMAKTLGGKAARRISQECLDLLGSLGLSEEFLAGKWFRDARIDIFEGAGEINRPIVARRLLGYSSKELAM